MRRAVVVAVLALARASTAQYQPPRPPPLGPPAQVPRLLAAPPEPSLTPAERERRAGAAMIGAGTALTVLGVAATVVATAWFGLSGWTLSLTPRFAEIAVFTLPLALSVLQLSGGVTLIIVGVALVRDAAQRGGALAVGARF